MEQSGFEFAPPKRKFEVTGLLKRVRFPIEETGVAHLHRGGAHQQCDLILIRKIAPCQFQILGRQVQTLAGMTPIEA